MISIFKILQRRSYPLNIIELSRQNLEQNYQYLASLHQNLKVAPVLKSNAYGHGLKEIGKMVDGQNPPFICVDSLYEAYILQKEGIKSQILIMGYIDSRSLIRKKLPFSYAIFGLDQAKALNKFQPGAKVHIFFDTGMHREGVPLDDLNQFLKDLSQFKNLEIEGIMSHLAATSADLEKLWVTQVKNFKKGLDIIRKNGIYPKWVHIGASGAILNQKLRDQIGECSNVVRTGKAFYGITLGDTKVEVKPILALKSKIYQVKKIKKGAAVGYDGSFIAKKDMTIATLPLGYFDGVDRRLSNKGAVLVEGVECPIIGRVSMNITTIDISQVENPKVGMEAVVISSNPTDPNSIENFATISQTIPHDLLVHLAESTRREIV